MISAVKSLPKQGCWGLWLLGGLWGLACTGVEGECEILEARQENDTWVVKDTCNSLSFCYVEERLAAGELGFCEGGERILDGSKPMPRLRSWHIKQDGRRKLALTWDIADDIEAEEAEGEGTEPRWLHGGGFEVLAEVDGSGSDKGFEVWAETAGGQAREGVCTVEADPQKLAKYTWRCAFAAGLWEGTEGAYKISIQPGANTRLGLREKKRERSYGIDALPPAINPHMEIEGNMWLGGKIRICAPIVTDNGSGIKSMTFDSFEVLAPKVLNAPTYKKKVDLCYEVSVPLNLYLSNGTTEPFQMEGLITAVDKVGNATAEDGETTLVRRNTSQVTRLKCLHIPEWSASAGPVNQPLVLGGQNIVFSSGVGEAAEDNKLYFYNKNCQLESILPMGSVPDVQRSRTQGTAVGVMVALGGSGKIALAANRVQADGRTQSVLGLVQDRQWQSETACVGSEVDNAFTAGSASFDKGLSLIRWPRNETDMEEGTGLDWKLSAPLNVPYGNSHLLEYTPNNVQFQARRCNTGTNSFSELFSAPPVWTGDGTLDENWAVVIRDSSERPGMLGLMPQIVSLLKWPGRDIHGRWLGVVLGTPLDIRTYSIPAEVLLHLTAPPLGLSLGKRPGSPLPSWGFLELYGQPNPQHWQVWIGSAGFKDYWPEDYWLANTHNLAGLRVWEWSNIRSSGNSVHSQTTSTYTEDAIATHSLRFPEGSNPTTPAAIDGFGRSYVVVRTNQTPPFNFELRRHAANVQHSPICGSLQCFQAGIPAERTATLPASIDGVAIEGIVGSPILGNPQFDSPEFYVVTTSGHVLAYRVSDFRLLWQLSTGIANISFTAQPLLVGNDLWLLGTRGEVAAVRVSSNGLSREAHWPKHLHDNCNTGNAGVSAANLRACVE